MRSVPSVLLRVTRDDLPHVPEWWNPEWAAVSVSRDASGAVTAFATRVVVDRAPFEGGWLIETTDRNLPDEPAILAALADRLTPAS